MVKRQSMIILVGVLALALGVQDRAFAVWPPSTAFLQEAPPLVYGLIVVAFVIGIVFGVWSQWDRHEHK